MLVEGLADKVAIVTGSGQGIGRAEARLLATKGASVGIWDWNLELAEETADLIIAEGGNAKAYQVDVTDALMVETTMKRVQSDFGPVAILVNNAGITRDNLLYKMSEDDWDAVMNIHLKGAFLCSRAAQVDMVQQRWGRIVLTSSTSALGNRGQSNYATAKAGLQGLTRTLAIELGPYNITVNAVAPGFIDTEMTRATARRLNLDPEQFKVAIASSVPVGRVGVPEDVAHAVAFFCAPESSYVSGQVLYVRGGP